MLKLQLRDFSGISWARMCKWGVSHTELPIIAKTRMGYRGEFCVQKSYFSYHVRKGPLGVFCFECWVSIFRDSDSVVIPALHKCSKATSSMMMLRQILSWLSLFSNGMEGKGQRYTLLSLTVKMLHQIVPNSVLSQMAKLSHRDQHVGNILGASVQLGHAIILGRKRKSKVLFQSYVHTNSGTDAVLAETSFISTAHVSTLLCRSRASFISHGKLFPNYGSCQSPVFWLTRHDFMVMEHTNQGQCLVGWQHYSCCLLFSWKGDTASERVFAHRKLTSCLYD